ncbi:MAG: tetratricopeptide repeat protein [bacterium]|nr:tetratricopeptide repeat protein [bacterium]
MDQVAFDKILQRWKAAEKLRMSHTSLLRTDSCPSFSQLMEGECSAALMDHIETCPHCARLKMLAEKYKNPTLAESTRKFFISDIIESMAGFLAKIKKFFQSINEPIKDSYPVGYKLVKISIPALMAIIILIFLLSPPSNQLAELAQIEPVYYRPIEIRAEAILSPSDRLFEQAMAHYSQQDYNGAIKLLSRLLAIDPSDVNVNFYLGLCYLLEHKPNQAIPHFNKVIELEGDFLLEKTYWYLGNAYLLKADAPEAIAAFEKVVEFAGDYEGEAREMIVKINNLR